MISSIQLKNVGPTDEMTVNFKDRINVITGDNGLGKTFLLDAVWWSLTRQWPRELNKLVGSGSIIRPSDPKKTAEISAVFDSRHKKGVKFIRSFDRKTQSWHVEQARPPIPGIVIYAQVDGSFSVWDPSRNYSANKLETSNSQEQKKAYVFTPFEILNGVSGSNGERICRGIYEDVANWFTSKDSENIEYFSSILSTLSPKNEPIFLTGTTRISVDDTREFPTICTPYEKNVPIIHASSAIKRIFSLAYILLWNWIEHQAVNRLLGSKDEKNIIFLIDEIESHLHPKWQRTITKSVLSIMKILNSTAKVQLIMTTHSPLVMASLEEQFDINKDAWIDFDLNPDTKQVDVTNRIFEKKGEVNNWLTSEAFDLKEASSLQYEEIVDELDEFIANPQSSKEDWDKFEKKLLNTVNDFDPLIVRYRFARDLKFDRIHD